MEKIIIKRRENDDAYYGHTTPDLTLYKEETDDHCAHLSLSSGNHLTSLTYEVIIKTNSDTHLEREEG